MRYMLMMYGRVSAEGSAPAGGSVSAPAAVPADDQEPCWMPWATEMKERGVILLDGAQLQGIETATTVRTDGAEVLIADGPFAETKEQLLGYDVIDCADLDEAIYAASRHPVALHGGVVEVRPILAS